MLSLGVAALLVLAGSAIQVAIGAGLSVVCGTFFLLWLGAARGLPVLLGLNLLVSLAATAADARRLPWHDVVLVALTTLAGCALAALVPALSDAALRAATAGVLLLAALPRSVGRAPTAGQANALAAAAGLVTGALTVWTATPGPIAPVALSRAGRSGNDIRRAMQPISIVGYGAALAFVGPRDAAAVHPTVLAVLAAATLGGVPIGFALRPRIDAALVVVLIRTTAAAAAALLLLSLLR